MNTLNEFFFEDIAYELDDYISSCISPTNEYKDKMIPFFVTSLHYFDNELNDVEKKLLSNIEIIWNSPGSVNVGSLKNIRKEISNYYDSIPIDNIQHRYFAACLEHLTFQYTIDSEVSPIWLYISGLIRASISLDWLYNNIVQRYSKYLSSTTSK